MDNLQENGKELTSLHGKLRVTGTGLEAESEYTYPGDSWGLRDRCDGGRDSPNGRRFGDRIGDVPGG